MQTRGLRTLHHSARFGIPAARGAPVEAKHQLVEVVVRMFVADRSWVRAEQPAFQ